MITDKEFLEKEWLQNCGDYVIVLRKSDIKDKWGEYLWEVNYKNNPLKENELRHKGEVIKGKCHNENIPYLKDKYKDNPLIESIHFIGRVRLSEHLKAEDFMNKIWPQKCGDSIKVLRPIKLEKERCKYGIKSKILVIYYECQFVNCPCEEIIISDKKTIKQGSVNNSKKEIEEFVGKRFKQKGGDWLTVLEKTNIKDGDIYLWKVKFDHFDYICLTSKNNIIYGEVENKNIPWKNKYNFKNFLDKKLQENNNEKLNFKKIYFVYFSWNITEEHLLKKIRQYNLIEYFKNLYNYIYEEDVLRNYIKEIYKGKVITYWGNKQDNYYELDIYLPDLKIAFEYNGSYWHKEGTKYGREIGYHEKKFKYFLQKGIIVFFVWDYFWFEDYEYRYKYKKGLIIRKEAKRYINNIINCYQKCLVNKF